VFDHFRTRAAVPGDHEQEHNHHRRRDDPCSWRPAGGSEAIPISGSAGISIEVCHGNLPQTVIQAGTLDFLPSSRGLRIPVRRFSPNRC